MSRRQLRAAARHFTRVAYQIITAFDDQPSAVDEAVGNFMTRVPVHGLRGGPCDVHPFGARLLIQAFQIDEPDGFIFLDRHDDGSVVNPGKRSEKRILRQAADASPLSGSGHDPFLCCPGTVPGPRHGVPHRSFLTYALFLHAAAVNNQAALFWGSVVLAALFPANIRKADSP